MKRSPRGESPTPVGLGPARGPRRGVPDARLFDALQLFATHRTILLAVSSSESHKIEVPTELGGERLDRALAALVPGESRTRLQALVREGRVRVDGAAVVRANVSVAPGASIELDLSPREAPQVTRSQIELAVLFEDEHLVAIDKPPGLVAHPTARGGDGSTIAEIAVRQFGELPSVQGEDRPGIVHRLDRLTSGVMVLGRTQAALENLKAQFKARSVEKTYWALAHGDPRFDSDWIENRIAPMEGAFDRFRALPKTRDIPVDEGRPGGPEPEPEDQRGREATTYYEVLERFRGLVSLACFPKTGRTHQIRVHLCAVGLPIVADRQYRPSGSVRHPLPPEAPVPDRQALHAQRLVLDHPVSGERLTFDSPRPDDMSALLTWLRRERADLPD